VSGAGGQRSDTYCRLIGWLEQPETKRKEFCSPPVSEEAEVADAQEAVVKKVVFDEMQFFPTNSTMQGEMRVKLEKRFELMRPTGAVE
jgi:hypothetical protein